MNWKDRFRPRIWTFVILIILLIAIVVVGKFFANIGGPNYFYLPFGIKQTSCGSNLYAINNCTYPWIPSGILLSVLFWLAIYAIISLLINRPKNTIPTKQ